MNVILILCDTLRRDHVGCYGSARTQTPSLDRLASRSVVFERALAASYPTLPCRAELFTRRFIYPYLSWGPLPRSEVLISELLGSAGYDTALVTDNPQLTKRNYHYDRGFATRIRVRGQIKDEYVTAPVSVTLPCSPKKVDEEDRTWSPYRPSTVWTDERSLVCWRLGNEPELYHLSSDPDQCRNIYADHRDVARGLHGRYVDLMQHLGSAAVHYWTRRLLRSVPWRSGQSSGALHEFAAAPCQLAVVGGSPAAIEGGAIHRTEWITAPAPAGYRSLRSEAAVAPFERDPLERNAGLPLASQYSVGPAGDLDAGLDAAGSRGGGKTRRPYDGMLSDALLPRGQ